MRGYSDRKRPARFPNGMTTLLRMEGLHPTADSPLCIAGGEEGKDSVQGVLVKAQEQAKDVLRKAGQFQTAAEQLQNMIQVDDGKVSRHTIHAENVSVQDSFSKALR